MAVIPIPSQVYFEKVDKLQLLRAGVSLRSRYTGKRQSVNFPFAVWYFEGRLIPVEGIQAGKWRSFLSKLQGMKNSFRLPVPGSSAPLSGFAGNANLNGAVAARAVSCSMLATPNTLILREGDYFNLGDELKIAGADATTNGAGTVTVPFEPATRGIHASNAVVTIQNPFIYMCAQADDSASWSLERPVRHGIKLICVEDI